MQVPRHYFISNDLDDLEIFEEQLEAAGVATPQIHILSLDDTAVENHDHLHNVPSIMKKDVIHSGEVGAVVGLLLAGVVLASAYLFNWTDTAAGWIPFIFLSVVLFGFCTWEGGFIGIQRSNTHFKRFDKVLEEGKHVFFIDLEPEQESILQGIVDSHAGLEAAGTEKGTPHWIIEGQKKIPKLLKETLP